MRATWIAVVSVLIATAAWAQEEKVKLKPGQGQELVSARCGMCHSADYIVMNSPFLDRSGWEKSVDKMIKTYGAPIGEPEREQIIEYLALNYGKGAPLPNAKNQSR